MTPHEAIMLLDTQLTNHGETVSITHGALTVMCRASVRGIKADEFVGPGVQGDYMVIISPTSLVAFGVPVVGDKMKIKGKTRQVKFVDPIYVNDVGVRCNLVVAG